MESTTHSTERFDYLQSTNNGSISMKEEKVYIIIALNERKKKRTI